MVDLSSPGMPGAFASVSPPLFIVIISPQPTQFAPPTPIKQAVHEKYKKNWRASQRVLEIQPAFPSSTPARSSLGTQDRVQSYRPKDQIRSFSMSREVRDEQRIEFDSFAEVRPPQLAEDDPTRRYCVLLR